MRARRHGAGGLEQSQLAAHRAAREIELHDLRCVPERDKGALSVSRHGQRDGISRGHSVAFREIEALLDCAGRHVKQHRIVREIFGNQQFFMAGLAEHRNRRRVGHALVAFRSPGQSGLPPRRQLRNGQRNQALGRNPALLETVDKQCRCRCRPGPSPLGSVIEAMLA